MPLDIEFDNRTLDSTLAWSNHVAYSLFVGLLFLDLLCRILRFNSVTLCYVIFFAEPIGRASHI